MFKVIDEKTGEVLARDLTLEALELWWKANGAHYFGVRAFEDGTVIVANTDGWKA